MFIKLCITLTICIPLISVDGNPVAMSEDHRVVSTTERARIAKLGHPLKDGESRICGMSPLLVMRT